MLRSLHSPGKCPISNTLMETSSSSNDPQGKNCKEIRKRVNLFPGCVPERALLIPH